MTLTYAQRMKMKNNLSDVSTSLVKTQEKLLKIISMTTDYDNWIDEMFTNINNYQKKIAEEYHKL